MEGAVQGEQTSSCWLGLLSSTSDTSTSSEQHRVWEDERGGHSSADLRLGGGSRMDEGDVGGLWAGPPLSCHLLSHWSSCPLQPRPKVTLSGTTEPTPTCWAKAGVSLD